MSEEHWIKMDDGRVFPDEEEMLATLLKENLLLVGCGKYVGDKNEIQKKTILLMVICSDVFAWGCCDCEEITTEELPELFKLYEQMGHRGITQWVCVKRNEQPQASVVAMIKRDNEWNEVFEGLPPNRYDAIMREKYPTKNENK